MDDAINYGAIGAVIGHELTHGFDDQGRQFDAKGNLQDWWTEADGKSFEEHAQCFVKEYEQFELPGGVHMNGKLTLGENTADNGGLRIAMMALMDSLAAKAPGPKDGFPPSNASSSAGVRYGARTRRRKCIACRNKPTRTRSPGSV